MKTRPLFSSIALLAALTLAPALVLVAGDESSALAVLASPDADLHAKAMACDELGRSGTAKAVPVLGALLADEKLNDYARDGLERISDPAAGKALQAALGTLDGNLRIGVIMTLGDRREAAAVPALEKIAKGEEQRAASAALSSLAQIASEEAGNAILAILKEGAADAKTAAAHAALAAAQAMQKDGRKEAAGKLRDAAAAAGVPTPAKKSATS